MHAIMNIKSCLFLLGIFTILTITILPVINAAAETNVDADADANTSRQIQQYDPPNVEGCGLIHIKNKKIIGGHDAAYGSHPWHGAMFRKVGSIWLYWCGSSLVNHRWIVTAAHCQYWLGNLTQTRDFYIRLGEWNLRSTSEKYMPENYTIEKREIHPNYIDSEPYPNDIALLKLDDEVSFKVHISPICFPKSDLNIINRTANVAGWGICHQNPKLKPDILQEVDVQVISNAQCKSWFNEVGHDFESYNDSFCAGYKSGGRDTCNLDSGGGLTLEEEGKHVLIGVVSWGYGCAKPNLPGIYTYVQTYMPWIIEKIK